MLTLSSFCTKLFFQWSKSWEEIYQALIVPTLPEDDVQHTSLVDDTKGSSKKRKHESDKIPLNDITNSNVGTPKSTNTSRISLVAEASDFRRKKLKTIYQDFLLEYERSHSDVVSFFFFCFAKC